VTTVLLKKGLRNVWMRGTRPLQPDQPRTVGRAFTLRFVPAREDLAMQEVENGSALPGLYPPNEQHKARHAASRRGGSR
jgi:regulator of RNase E activity RraA